jgi:hypothetical protein
LLLGGKMKQLLAKHNWRIAAISIALMIGFSASAATIRSISTFATGGAVNATGPDSIAVGGHSIWLSYTNGADSTGLSGSSTVVQYHSNGKIRRMFSIPGSVDGLKIDPKTGLVWALQNQDGNSTLTLIDPEKGITPNSPIPFSVTSGSRGYDEVVFRGDQVFLSYTNPTGSADPTIQLLQNGSNPLVVTTILTMGATGTNLATGQPNQPTTQSDPDSLKLAPNGDLYLASAADGQLIFVTHPGRPNQSVSFLTLIDPSTGLAVSELDDSVFATAEKGTFYLSDTGNNRVLKIEVEDLNVGSLWASVGNLNELATVDTTTGFVTAEVINLKAPHGLVFVPRGDDDESDR